MRARCRQAATVVEAPRLQRVLPRRLREIARQIQAPAPDLQLPVLATSHPHQPGETVRPAPAPAPGLRVPAARGQTTRRVRQDRRLHGRPGRARSTAAAVPAGSSVIEAEPAVAVVDLAAEAQAAVVVAEAEEEEAVDEIRINKVFNECESSRWGSGFCSSEQSLACLPSHGRGNTGPELCHTA